MPPSYKPLIWTLLAPEGFRSHYRDFWAFLPQQNNGTGQHATIPALFPGFRHKPGNSRQCHPGHGGRKSGLPDLETGLSGEYSGTAGIHPGNPRVNSVLMKGYKLRSYLETQVSTY